MAVASITRLLLLCGAVTFCVADPPSGFTTFRNWWDGALDYRCPTNQVLRGIYSEHHNHYEDRRWAFKCTTSDTTGEITADDLNNWDGAMDFSCLAGKTCHEPLACQNAPIGFWYFSPQAHRCYHFPYVRIGCFTSRTACENQCKRDEYRAEAWAISGALSYHNNHREDRIWKFRCETLENPGLKLVHCKYSTWNWWDAVVNFSGNTKQLITGARSYHNNYREDRRWSWQYCDVDCDHPWVRSGADCVCASGYFYSSKQCKVWKKCQKGQYQSRTPTATSDRSCSSCGTGKYQNENSHAQTGCKNCLAGKYQDTKGTSVCKSCSSSKYQNSVGQTSCKSCSSGYYRSSASAQAKCGVGYKCSSCARTACAAGSYQNESGKSSCKACSSTTWQDKTTQTSCKSCSSGYYRTSATAQKICPAGYKCSSCRATKCTLNSNYQVEKGKTTCLTVTKCGKGQYASTTPTITRNRACSTCPGGKYMDESSHGLTSCKTKQTCKVGQETSSDGGTTANRSCKNCVLGTSYQNLAGQSSCKPVAAKCAAGQYQRLSPTLTRNRECRACTSGKYQSESGYTGSSCKTWAPSCGAGTHQSGTPDARTNRVCVGCSTGKFQDQVGQTECDSFTTCSIGYRVSVQPNSQRDRVCAQCDGTTGYQNEQNQASCKSVNRCSGTNQYTRVAATRVQNSQCGTCVSQCNSNEYLTGTCGGNSNTRCESCHATCSECTGPHPFQCTKCPLGWKITTGDDGVSGICSQEDCRIGTYEKDQQCLPCDHTCFECNAGAATNCLACSGQLYLSVRSCVAQCPAGHYKLQQTNNNECKACATCPFGKYAKPGSCSGTSNTECVSVTSCTVGQGQSTAPTTSSDRVCTACTAGKFQDVAGQISCKDTKVCQAGEEQATPPTPSTDRVCKSCSVGHFQPKSGETKCLPCAAGQYQSLPGKATCFDCGVGRYQGQQGQSDCNPIAAGYYGSGGSPSTYSGQTPCEPGYYCPGGAAGRLECDGVQHYQNLAKQTKCKATTFCNAGFYASQAATSSTDRVCSKCPSGKYNDQAQNAATSCESWTVCSGSTVQSVAPTSSSDRQCSSCGTGFYMNSNSQCVPYTVCQVGTAESAAPTGSTDRQCSPCVLGVNFQDQSGQTSCKTLKACSAGQAQSTPPTTSSDRTCVNCNGVTNYQGEANQPSCEDVDPCQPGEYESTAPTSKSNRICSACPSGQYQSEVGAPKSCKPIIDCLPGFYQTVAATPENNRECKPCPTGMYQEEANKQSCSSWTTCNPGFLVQTVGSPRSDRICKPCLSNQFQDEVNQPTCTPYTICGGGTHEIAAPTTTSDRQCESCDGETTYQNEVGQSSCKPLTTCDASEYETKSPTESSNRVCLPCQSACPTGQYLKGACTETTTPVCAECHQTCSSCSGPSSSQCTSCFAPLSLSQGSCVSECNDGQFENSGTCTDCHSSCADCSGPGANQCLLCAGNLFLSHTGECVESCPTGRYGADNRCLLCTSCASGKYRSAGCSGSDNAICSDWTVCQPGERQSKGPTAVSDRQCVKCVAGSTFQSEEGQGTCDAVTPCSSGEFISLQPTASSDSVCQHCLHGTYNNEANQPSCTPCPPGKFQNVESATNCKDCGLGFYQPSNGASICQQIAPGFYGAGGTPTARTAQVICQPGFSCLGGSHDKQACSVGTQYQNEAGQNSCKDATICTIGQAVTKQATATSDRVCSACTLGKYQPNPNSEATSCTEWTECEAGEYQSNPPTASSDRQCLQCADGTFQTEAGKLQCNAVTTCDPGFYESVTPTHTSDSVCSTCPSGKYQNNPGQTSCLDVTVCTAGHRQAIAPTSQRDRVCGQCNGVNEYQNENGKLTCKPVTFCGKGQKQTSAPTTTANRGCGPCATGTYQNAASHDESTCMAVTECEIGEFIKTAATLSSDAKCSSCAADTYQDEENQASCKSATGCGKGQFMARAASVSTNRVCETCPEGTYQNEAGTLSSCKTVTVCPPGTKQVNAPTTSSDRTCTACTAGTFTDENNEATCQTVTPCSPTEYESEAATLTSDRTCTACTSVSDCHSNQFLSGTCSLTSNPTCQACHASCASCSAAGPDACTACASKVALQVSGSVSQCVDTCSSDRYYTVDDTTGQASCEVCDTTCNTCDGAADSCTSCDGTLYLTGGACENKCPANTYKKTSPNNNVCEACSVCTNGRFASSPCGAAVDTACTAWTTCQPGTHIKTLGSATTNRVCEACIAGETYQDEENQSACKPVTPCLSGHFVATPGTATTDQICQSCDQGKYSSGTNADECSSCLPGTYQDVRGAPSCKECGLQQYQNEAAKTNCKTIPAGSYGIKGSASTRQDIATCDAGNECPGGAAPQTPCDGSSEYQNEKGQATCKEIIRCAAGESETTGPTTTSNRICGDCENGFYMTASNHDESDCIPLTVCQPGTKQLVAGSKTANTQCAACNGITEYQNEEGQTGCKTMATCDAGTRRSRIGSTTSNAICINCVAGLTFQTQINHPVCLPVTTCTAGERQILAPTTKSNRQCASCNGISEYQPLPGQDTCVAATQCSTGQFQSRPPTPSSDRVCSACPSGTYQGASVHLDTSCRKVSVCYQGTYEAQSPTPSSDRVCEPCTPGVSYQDEIGATSCKPVRLCEAGQKVRSDPTTYSDRICVTCDQGTFQPEGQSAISSCTPVRTCGAGTFVAAVPTASSNRVCVSCDGISEYQSEAGQSFCDTTTNCASYEYVSKFPTPQSNRECTNCTTSCRHGFHLTGTCGGLDGTDNPTCELCAHTCQTCSGPAANQCKTCMGSLQLQQDGTCKSTCPEGQYSDGTSCKTCDNSCKTCTGAGPSACSSCSGSSLLNDENQCADSCPSGFYGVVAENECKVCSVCQGSMYAATACSATADTVCEPWTKCQPGQKQQTAPTNTQNRVCVSCDVGTEYQPLPDQVFCLPVQTCVSPAEEIEGGAPTATSDRICACDKGLCTQSFNSMFEQEMCRDPTADELDTGINNCCDGVTYGVAVDNLKSSQGYFERHSCPGCTATCLCTAGYKLVDYGSQETCEACDGVTEYQNLAGSRVCKPVTVCGVGFEESTAPTASSDRICTKCDAGTYDDDEDGSTDCVACAAGEYSSPGQSTCSPCPAGTADLDTDPGTPCVACVVGLTYQPAKGENSCKPVTTCGAGEEEVSPPTAISDRVCTPCLLRQSFKTITGQGIGCQPVTECGAGEEETAEPTLTSDRVCTRCPAETYKPHPGQGSCVSVATCAKGFEESQQPTTVSNRQCRSCVPGVSFKPAVGQNTTCQAVTRCTITQYESQRPTTTSDTVCTDLETCSSTQYESSPQSFFSNRQCADCTDCPDGRFQIVPCTSDANAQCSGCKECGPGTYLKSSCTAEQDTDCEPCDVCRETEFQLSPCTATSPGACETVTLCGFQQFAIRLATATEDTECADLTVCDAGHTYESVAPTSLDSARGTQFISDRECEPLTECERGEQQDEAPTPKDNRKCSPCPAGTLDQNPNTFLCESCGAGGYYIPAGQFGNCIDWRCKLGEADLDGNAATPCVPCPTGYVDTLGAIECKPWTDCGIGEEQLIPATSTANRVCISCDEGVTFKAEAGQTESCQNVRNCDLSMQYITAEPTVSSNRECADATECTDTQYQVTPLQKYADRQCKNLTVCTLEEYEEIPPAVVLGSIVSNRVCKPISECVPKVTFELKPPTTTSNRVCQEYTECADDEYAEVKPTPTSDRECVEAWEVRLFFDADYDSYVGNESLKANFTEEMLDEFADLGIDNRTSFRGVRFEKGSFLVFPMFIDQTSAENLVTAMAQGLVNIGGLTSTICGPNEYPANWDQMLQSFAPADPSNPAIVDNLQVDPDCQPQPVCGKGEVVDFAGNLTHALTCKEAPTTPVPTQARSGTTTTEGPGSEMGIGIIILIVLVVILVVIAIMWVAMWHNRKSRKDKETDKMLDTLASRLGMMKSNDLDNNLDSGNALLRQLSTKRGPSATVFDNPMFKQMDQPSAAAGYLDVAPDWLKGKMSREEAEEWLYGHYGNPGDFLIRESSSNNNWVLSVLIEGDTCEHHRLNVDNRNRFQINGNPFSSPCLNIVDVVQHLAKNFDGVSVLLNYQEHPEAESHTYGQVQREQQAEFYGAVTREVPQTISAKPEWLFGQLSRPEAEAKLAEIGLEPGNFLVRNGKQGPDSYTVSLVIADGRIEHHILNLENDGAYSMNGQIMSRNLTSIHAVVEHLYSYPEMMSNCLYRDCYPLNQQQPAESHYDQSTPSRTMANPSYNEAFQKPGNVGYDQAFPGESTYAAVDPSPASSLVNPTYHVPTNIAAPEPWEEASISAVDEGLYQNDLPVLDGPVTIEAVGHDMYENLRNTDA